MSCIRCCCSVNPYGCAAGVSHLLRDASARSRPGSRPGGRVGVTAPALLARLRAGGTTPADWRAGAARRSPSPQQPHADGGVGVGRAPPPSGRQNQPPAPSCLRPGPFGPSETHHHHYSFDDQHEFHPQLLVSAILLTHSLASLFYTCALHSFKKNWNLHESDTNETIMFSCRRGGRLQKYSAAPGGVPRCPLGARRDESHGDAMIIFSRRQPNSPQSEQGTGDIA